MDADHPSYGVLFPRRNTLNESDAIAIYAGAGCDGAHDEVVATAARLNAPMAHTSRGKDFEWEVSGWTLGVTLCPGVWCLRPFRSAGI